MPRPRARFQISQMQLLEDPSGVAGGVIPKATRFFASSKRRALPRMSWCAGWSMARSPLCIGGYGLHLCELTVTFRQNTSRRCAKSIRRAVATSRTRFPSPNGLQLPFAQRQKPYQGLRRSPILAVGSLAPNISVKRTQTRYAGCAAYEERMLAWVRMPEDIEHVP